MMNQRLKKKSRIRIFGTASRPRLAVFRSLNNLRAQLIDDEARRTIVSASSLKESGSLSQKARAVGQNIAKKALAAKVEQAVFDRSGFTYQGVIKILAEAAREGGLKF